MSSAPASTPLRQDLVINAVNFLKNPNVANTPKARRIAFLEQKGLTSAEIQEALARVNAQGEGGDKPTASSSSQPSYSPQASSQPSTSPPSQPTYAPPTAYQPNYNYVAAPPPYLARIRGHHLPLAQPSRSSTWKIVTLTAVFTATFGTGLVYLIKKYVVPLIKRKYPLLCQLLKLEVEEKVEDSKEDKEVSDDQDTDNKREKLRRRNEDDEQKKLNLAYLQSSSSSLATLTSEMLQLRSSLEAQSKAIDALVATSSTSKREETSEAPSAATSSSSSSSSSSTVTSVHSSSTSDAPYPSNFVEIASMISEGKTPPGIKTVDDKPTMKPIVARQRKSAPKPWEKRRLQKKQQQEQQQEQKQKQQEGQQQEQQEGQQQEQQEGQQQEQQKGQQQEQQQEQQQQEQQKQQEQKQNDQQTQQKPSKGKEEAVEEEEEEEEEDDNSASQIGENRTQQQQQHAQPSFRSSKGKEEAPDEEEEHGDE